MKLEIIILALIFFVLFMILIFKKTPEKQTKIKIGSTEIKAEIADTNLKRIKGLMFRKALPENEGMLFVFEKEDYHTFWMMNMSFPIDIVWINKDKEIIDIVKNAQPCRISCTSFRPKNIALYVLEVNANFTDKRNIQIGSKVEFDISS